MVLLSTAALSGCARAKAKTMPAAPPPLDVPAPPPRDVEAPESEPPMIVPLPQEPARNPPPRPRANPAPTRPPDAKPEPPKPEPADSETPRVDEPPKTPMLQTTQSQNEAEAERAVRATLSRASQDLNRVDYRVLNSDARTQYDTAKGFITEADKALRAKNLIFAKTLADKAAAIATQLGGR